MKRSELGIYDRIFKPYSYTLPNGKKVDEKRSRLPMVLLILLLATIVSGEVTGFRISTLVRRINYFFVMLFDMFPPDWSYMAQVWTPLWDTIKMSLLGSAIGAVLCVPFAVLSSSNLVKQKAVTAFFKFFFSVVRTPIAVFTFAYCGKILYEQIETVDMGSHEALEALGMGRLSAIRYSVWPQVLPSFLSTVLFCFEGNVRYASILGYVGAGGLGLILNEKIGWREYSRVGMILIALFVAVVVIETLSSWLRSKLT